MNSRYMTWFVGVLLLLALSRSTAAAETNTEQIRADEQTLKKLNLDITGPGLLEFFRKHTVADTDRNKILALIQKLGDDSFDVREKATVDLIALGGVSVPLLKEATKDPDIEVQRRAERCLEIIDKVGSVPVLAAAARLVAQRKPEGAAQALLAYLPSAEDELVVEEVRAALVAVALRNGQPEKAILDALEDKIPVRRGAAGEALIRAGGAEYRQTGRKLLEDKNHLVRLQAALALVETKDKDAVATLIALLADLPRDHGWKAEEVLYRIAGEQAPNTTLGTTAAEREKSRATWSKWWEANAAKIDLAKLDLSQRLLGYTLVVELKAGNLGRVVEFGQDKKVRWQIDNLQYPVDAQVLPGDRVLIAEYTGRRVTERNLKGDILWQKDVANYPIGCQRLPNGNTFIVCKNMLLEVDAKGNEVFRHTVNLNAISGAQKLRDGHMAYITSNGVTGTFVRLDATGKEVKSFPVAGTYTGIPGGGGMDVLANGRVVVPHYNTNRVTEYETDGKSHWETAATRPTFVARLPNGNTLIGGMLNPRVVEVDRTGKEVWEYTGENRLLRVRRR